MSTIEEIRHRLILDDSIPKAVVPTYTPLNRSAVPTSAPEDFIDFAQDFDCDCQPEAACNCEFRISPGIFPEKTLFPYTRFNLERSAIRIDGKLTFLVWPGMNRYLNKVHLDGCHAHDPIESHRSSCPYRYPKMRRAYLQAFYELLLGLVPESLDSLPLDQKLNLLD